MQIDGTSLFLLMLAQMTAADVQVHTCSKTIKAFL